MEEGRNVTIVVTVAVVEDRYRAMLARLFPIRPGLVNPHSANEVVRKGASHTEATATAVRQGEGTLRVRTGHPVGTAASVVRFGHRQPDQCLLRLTIVHLPLRRLLRLLFAMKPQNLHRFMLYLNNRYMHSRFLKMSLKYE